MRIDWMLFGAALGVQLLTLLGGVIVAWMGIDRRLSRLEGRMETLLSMQFENTKE